MCFEKSVDGNEAYFIFVNTFFEVLEGVRGSLTKRSERTTIFVQCIRFMFFV
jgi:hypothetical protein